jgi:hypothetical protein
VFFLCLEACREARWGNGDSVSLMTEFSEKGTGQRGRHLVGDKSVNESGGSFTVKTSGDNPTK